MRSINKDDRIPSQRFAGIRFAGGPRQSHPYRKGGLGVLRRYWRQICITVVLLGTLMVSVWFAARSSVENYIVNVNRMTMQSTVEQVNDMVDDIHRMTYQLARSSLLGVIRRSEDIFAPSNIIHTLKYQWEMENFGVYNNMVAANYTVFLKSGYVIMPGAGQDFASFARMFSDAEYPAGYDVQTFAEKLKNAHNTFLSRMQFSLGNELSNLEVLPYVIWSGNNFQDRSAAILTLVDAAKFDDMLAQALTAETSVLCVCDETNQVIASGRPLTSSEKERISSANASSASGVRYYSSETRVPHWRLVLLASDQEVAVALRQFDILIQALCAFCLAIVACLTVVFLLKNRRVLVSIYSMMDADKAAGTYNTDVYASIHYGIRVMMEDKALMQARLKEQESVLREVYINNLLKGESAHGEAPPGVLQELGLYAPDFSCRVAVLTMAAEDVKNLPEREIQGLKNIILETVRLFSREILPCTTSRYEVALIVRTNGMDEAQSLALVENLYQALMSVLRENRALRVSISLGAQHMGEGAAALSYSEARSVLMNASFGESAPGVLCYARREDAGTYYYPPEVEMQFINAIRAGNRAAVEQVIAELFDRNIAKNVDYEITLAFLYDFYGSVLKMPPATGKPAAVQGEILRYFQQCSNEIGTIGFQKRFAELVYRLTDSYAEIKKSHNSAVVEKVRAYVEENYASADLTLYGVAEECKLSSGYLSALFREQTGMAFSDFLTLTRMNRAKELLAEADLPIHEIARRTGYASSNVFCRAFKKYYGVSPMQMREGEQK